jgi:NAD-dependent deacetylase
MFNFYTFRQVKNLVIISGAGISAESGISTFRDSNGLWENFKIEEVATPQAWKHNPDLVQEFYNTRRKQVMGAAPNAAHLFFKELEKHYNVIVVTQNIDDLHERAGSENVIHLHGNIRLAKSSGPNQEKRYYPIDGWELTKKDVCEDGFLLRPHVVWFGEEVPELEKAAKIVSEADCLIVIGTSLQVYPAASLIHFTSDYCQKIIVDPKVSELKVDSGYLLINETAVNSIPKLRELLGV